MSHAYLSLGSNVDPGYHIGAAVRALQDRFVKCRLSPIYRSRAVGFSGEDFINLVACVETRLSPEDLRHCLRDLEDRYGRDRSGPKFSDRTLDIDILLYDDLVLLRRELQLPRPEILKFAHVLKPLADLAPGLRHPVEHKTMADLWNESGLQGIALEEIELGFGDGGPGN
jgi:2-amino-4-hydroxy-6-hydroxymethyldihydropteridine diphosphokinase